MEFTTGSGATWNTDKEVRTSMFTANKEMQYFPVCKLTGKFENHTDKDGNIESMVEIETQYDEPVMVWEQFVSQ